MRRDYLVWVEVESQPNVLEKLAGFLRRRSYRYRRLVFTNLDERSSLIMLEVSCNDYELQQLLKNYEGYPETISIGYYPMTSEVYERLEDEMRVRRV